MIFLQIATRLRKSFDVEISFREMFDMPTVAQLAEAVVRELATAMGNDDLEKMIAEISDLSAQELRDSIEAEK